jgi:hypothetical protein
VAELIENQGKLLERHCKVGILQVGCSCARNDKDRDDKYHGDDD